MDISVEHHSHDGFTLYATDSRGYLVHRRYVGYSMREAMSCFQAVPGTSGRVGLVSWCPPYAGCMVDAMPTRVVAG
jgi:hypothetical protein